MFYTLSRSDIRFLDVFYKIGAVLAIVPPYSFEESRLLNPLFAKLQSTIYAVLLIAGSCISLRARTAAHASFYTLSQQVLDYLNEIAIVAVTITAMLSSCHVNQRKWMKLNNAFQYIDKKFGTRNKKVPFHQSAAFQLILWNAVIFCGILLAAWSSVSSVTGWKSFNTYLTTNVCAVYFFFIQMLACNIVAAFKQRYNHLNRCLTHLHSNRGDFVACLRDIGVTLRLLSEMVETFNALFGWVFVLIMLVTGMNILLCLSFSFSASLGSAQIPFDTVARITGAISALLILISTSIVLITCDFAKKESQRTARLCYKLQEQIPAHSLVRRELLLLAVIASNNVASFTAADFFELKRSTLCAILGTTATYLIVMIQFNNNIIN